MKIKEMDKSAPQPGRDGKVSHSTYGTRGAKRSDYYSGKEAPGKPVTRKKATQDALDILKKQGVAETKLDELSNELLGRYKKAAGADARAADKRGDYKRGDKRFSGILKATGKEFTNALRNVKEGDDPSLPGAPPGVKIMTPQEFVAGKQDVEEETKLPAPARELKGQELTDYLDRIRSKEKKKTDKYKLPYIHRSDVVKYYSADGNRYDVDAIKAALRKRPEKLLKKNEKMRHSDGTYEQFFNVGFAALVGLALDESTDELIVVNTCPGAGSCKIECFAMKGGKVQFAPAWMSDSRILTYLLNDPDGFFAKVKSEIEAQVKAGAKKNIKVSIRWHDAGDFFSPEYVGLAFKLARELPMVDFYAYTKIGNVAIGEKPENFIINWSEGAHPSQERIVKKDDQGLESTKNSRIVPSRLFYDLLVKDEKKNLVKGPEGQWQVIPDKLSELKQRLASEYGISANSILSYSEWDSKVRGKDKTPLKYNVIITPGEPDITAKDPGVLSTLLLKH
jgi:hypothetical protein